MSDTLELAVNRLKCVVRANGLEQGDVGDFVHRGAYGTVYGVWMREGARTPKGKPLAVCVDALGSWIQGSSR